MDMLRLLLLALLAIYILGLLVNLAGVGRLPEPARYHVGALVIYLLAVGGGGYALADTDRPDFAGAAVWLLGPVVVWWVHQLWSHRERPNPHTRPKPPGWTPPA